MRSRRTTCVHGRQGQTKRGGQPKAARGRGGGPTGEGGWRDGTKEGRWWRPDEDRRKEASGGHAADGPTPQAQGGAAPMKSAEISWMSWSCRWFWSRLAGDPHQPLPLPPCCPWRCAPVATRKSVTLFWGTHERASALRSGRLRTSGEGGRRERGIRRAGFHAEGGWGKRGTQVGGEAVAGEKMVSLEGGKKQPGEGNNKPRGRE